MSKILTIDSASKTLYVLLITEKKTEKIVIADSQKQHSVILNNAVQKLLEDNDCSLSDIDIFAVCIGTGSFTGIRVGVSVVKAFNLVLNKKLVEVNSLHTLAYTKTGRVNCLMNAGKGWYYAVYDGIQEITSPTLIADDQAEMLMQRSDTVVFDEKTDYSQAIELQVVDKVRLGLFSQTLTPLYIRKCQAEEELKQ